MYREADGRRSFNFSLFLSRCVSPMYCRQYVASEGAAALVMVISSSVPYGLYSLYWQGCMRCNACNGSEISVLWHAVQPCSSRGQISGSGTWEELLLTVKHASQIRWGMLVGPHAPAIEIRSVVEKNAFPSKNSSQAQRSQSWYMHLPGSGPMIPWPCLLILRPVLRVDLESAESLPSTLGEGEDW